jgi:hypothetical protein
MTFNTNNAGAVGPGQLAQPLIIAPTTSSMPFMSTGTAAASGSGMVQPTSLFPLLTSNQFQQPILAAPTAFNSSPLNMNPIASNSMSTAPPAASTNPFLMM